MSPAKPALLGQAMCPFTRRIVVLLVLSCSLPLAITAIPFNFQPPPIFLSQRDFEVNENDPIGTRVFRVSVDQKPPAVTFSITNSNHKDGSKYFRIDETTGEIYLKESLQGLGGDDVYFYVIAHSSQNARCEFRVRVNKVANYAKKPLPPLGSYSNAVGNGPKLPQFSIKMPKEKPDNTEFPVTPAVVQSASTPSPPKKPHIDRFNNLLQNNSNASWKPSQVGEKSSSIDDGEAKVSTNEQLPTWWPYLAFTVVFFIVLVVFVAIRLSPRKVTSRNVIKTFSHKIINNNKSDGSETTISSSFSSDVDYNGALFRTKKSLAGTELSAGPKKSLLKVSDGEWEFPRHHLKFIHILGEGCFGQVWKCEAVNIGNTGSSQVVAVKTLKQNANQKEKEDLLEELDVMKMLEPHPNVVTLIGCCAEQDPVLLIMEFIPNGTLQSYLRQSRGDLNYGQLNANGPLTSNDLISFVYQIAKGMEYLSSKGIIHRDLAARNILVGYNKRCKIADFGFAKYDDVYERKSEGRLPIRWMAVESLTDFVFTTKSDVWSFGILMWEIVTLGWTPYPGFAAAEVIKKVCEGYRLEKPEHCKREIFNIMYYCWDKDPTKRPSFSELVSLLDNILCSENEPGAYIELDRFPDHGYYNILKPGTTGEKL